MLREFNCHQFGPNLYGKKFIDLRVVVKINSHEASKFRLSSKTSQNLENFKLFSLSIKLQIRHYKTKYRIDSVFKQEIYIKTEKKLATKEKKE